MRAPRALASALVLVALAATGCTDDRAESASAEGLPASDPAAGPTTTTTPPQLFSSDFHTVCAGASQSKASPYVPGEPGPHKMMLIQGAKGEMYEQTVDIPEDWRVSWDPESDALTAIELVVCSTATPGAVVKECDGYEDSAGNATGQKVLLRNATYDLVVREATTGNEVTSTTIVATDDSCPMVVSSDTTEELASNNLAIVEFLTPIVQG